MKLAALLAGVMVWAGALAAGGAIDQFDPAMLSQPQYSVTRTTLVNVKMRDGVSLSTDIYRPDAPGQFPTLLWRTPYGNNSAGINRQSRWYASRGYVVVKQDVRGKYDSGGTFVPFRNEARDGYDTEMWIGHQPWSNGKIGLMGGSYLGYAEIAEGLQHSPYLKTISASVTTGDIYNGWVYSDGALFLGFAFPWGAIAEDGHVGQYTPRSAWPKIFRHLPLMTMDEAAGHHNLNYRQWLKHPRANDPFWNGVSYETDIKKMPVPLLVIDGWYDLFLRGALHDQLAIRQHGEVPLARNNKQIIIGPWIHAHEKRTVKDGAPTTGPDRTIDFGPTADVNLWPIYLRWNDHWLKGKKNGVENDPPLKIFVMGINQWRDEYEWPLARTQFTKYYIDSAGRANSAAGDGTLSTAPPKGVEVDHFTYDPAHPVPTLGGNTCCSVVPAGPWDQRDAEIRRDVLVYTTPVLTQPVEVTGPIKMTLYAATDGKDTDWTAKLVDVHPDGYAQNIQDGIIRARYRRGTTAPAQLLKPGKVYKYTIDLWATSNVFLPGHRIRVEISSSNFPRFDRNLNTGADPMTSTKMRVAHQTIYHSKEYPSAIILPIIPATGKKGSSDGTGTQARASSDGQAHTGDVGLTPTHN